MSIPVILQVTWVLPAFSPPNHIVVYAHLWAELVVYRSLELFRICTRHTIKTSLHLPEYEYGHPARCLLRVRHVLSYVQFADALLNGPQFPIAQA